MKSNLVLTTEIGPDDPTESCYRRLVESLGGEYFFYQHGVDGVFTYISPSIQEVLGYSQEEFKTHYSRYLTDNPVNQFATQYTQLGLQNTPQPPYLLEIFHKDQSLHWIEVKETPVLNDKGQVIAIEGIARDVTKQEQTKNQMHEELFFKHSLLETIPSPVFYKDLSGRFLGCNKAFEDFVNLPKDQIIGKTTLSISSPTTAQACLTTDEELFEKPGTSRYEMCFQLPDGTAKYVIINKATFTDTQEQVKGVVAVITDITKHKQSEQDLKQANHDLKLLQMQSIQNEKLASIGQLAAGVAHEVNTPIGFVGSNFQSLVKYMQKFLELFGYYEKLLDQVENGSRSERLDLMERIKIIREEIKIDFVLDDIQSLLEESQEGIQRVSAIVKNLKDFSRMDPGEERTDFDLNEGVQSTLMVARNEIKYDAEVATTLSDIPKINGNPSQINQVLLALLVNAAQAIKSQERSDKGQVTIKTYLAENQVVCEISDDGPGIPAEQQHRIFDPFFTTKPAGQGTGLGLSVAHDIIVNKHHGQLTVQSAPDQGATFIIQLPIENDITAESRNDSTENRMSNNTCGEIITT